MDSGLSDFHPLHIFKSLKIKPKKSWGQSFLQNLSLLDQPLSFLGLKPGGRVLEIGAGIGNVTERIAPYGAKVLAIEIDRRFTPILTMIEKKYPNVQILYQDALSLTWDELWQGESYDLFGNVPYYITGPILEKILLKEKNWQKAALLLQEEVAERILSPPGSKSYSSLSVIAQFKARLSRGPRVPKGCFFPPPKVDSLFLFLERKATPDFYVSEENFFLRLVRGAFRERRKTLRNNLLRLFPSLSPDILNSIEESTGISLSRRPETLSLKEYCLLENALFGAFYGKSL